VLEHLVNGFHIEIHRIRIEGGSMDFQGDSIRIEDRCRNPCLIEGHAQKSCR
jgi:hypothetical protein